MKANFTKPVSILASLLFCKVAMAGPWYTGPLLAPSGHTIPKGHTNLETYLFYNDNDGVYDKHWKLTHTPANISTIINPIFSHGLTDRMDIQFILPYTFNRFRGSSSHKVSDTAVTLGYQVLEQKDSKWRPDLRFTIQETLPTGQYEHLSPFANGTDASGIGSYQTALALNFQHLKPFNDTIYLRTRLSLAYMHANDVRLRGFNTFGGGLDTDATLDPGDLVSIDLAGELSLTQHWVAVLEGYAANRQATTFRGNPGTTAAGLPAPLGHGTVDQITYAPAIEYNFNENIGLIGGVWKSATGKDTGDFTSYVLALNAYW